MEIEVGTVIKWEEYDRPRYGNRIKPRWFIVLARSEIFSCPLLYYLPTTTTSLQRLVEGRYYTFERQKFPFFDDDVCYLDYDEKPHIRREDELDSTKINVKGCFDHNILKEIYRGISESEMAYSYDEKLEIYKCLDIYGVQGIKRPTPPKRK